MSPPVRALSKVRRRPLRSKRPFCHLHVRYDKSRWNAFLSKSFGAARSSAGLAEHGSHCRGCCLEPPRIPRRACKHVSGHRIENESQLAKPTKTPSTLHVETCTTWGAQAWETLSSRAEHALRALLPTARALTAGQDEGCGGNQMLHAAVSPDVSGICATITPENHGGLCRPFAVAAGSSWAILTCETWSVTAVHASTSVCRRAELRIGSIMLRGHSPPRLDGDGSSKVTHLLDDLRYEV